MSCLKGVLKLEVEQVKLPTIKIWKKGQLSLAEMLITYLASSLAHESGFNILCPGAHETNETNFDKARGQMACAIDNEDHGYRGATWKNFEHTDKTIQISMNSTIALEAFMDAPHDQLERGEEVIDSLATLEGKMEEKARVVDAAMLSATKDFKGMQE
ncbi:hypothetical protein DSL72_002628 [Monilinia vaccinii-corymbosi]|uniref:Uncharacterized protein n=1 Tax=Monilinia vaccinii-corymbosi TaxID=61207 RepID=A0A8A3PD87_9HELO|nr:hypothetical protein DSL72_002628 [Monilinia vaccinii-corymbosi]